jgi:N-terminal domain of ribose phosphate pyrophosphokinase
MAFLSEAAQGSSAGRITLVPTYLGYNRQDRKDRPRVPISSRTIMHFLAYSGADRALFFDLHSEPTAGFMSNLVVDHLYASKISVPYLRKGLLLTKAVCAGVGIVCRVDASTVIVDVSDATTVWPTCRRAALSSLRSASSTEIQALGFTPGQYSITNEIERLLAPVTARPREVSPAGSRRTCERNKTPRRH